jgi:hypothetical protein
MFSPYEHPYQVNTLIDDAVAVLADLRITATPEQTSVSDGAVALDLVVDAGEHGRRRYAVMLKPGRLDRQRATAMVLPSVRPLLLVAAHVPDPVAKVLLGRGVDHVDAAGNVRLAWDGMLLDVRGRRPRATSRPRSDAAASRAFTRSGAMVVFALLSWPEISTRPVRDIAHASGAAVGTVHTVLSELSAAGYLYQSGEGKRLNRGGELLDRWAEAYAVNLGRKLPIASFALPDIARLPAVEKNLVERGAQLGGELAASRIDPHLRPATATFYVDDVPTDVLAQFRMRRDDDAGVVQFRHRFWQRREPGAPLVPSPLVYADLVSSGDPRQREHAGRIRQIDDRLVELDRA